MAHNLSRLTTTGIGSQQFSIAVMLALALTMPFWTMGGGAAVQTLQTASPSCTITAGLASCNIVITFSPPLTDIKTFKYTRGFQPITGNFFAVSTISKNYYILSLTSTGQTWTSMPAALTEIFGDVFHEVGFDQIEAGQNTTRFQVITKAVAWANIKTTSSSANARLRPQVSNDNGATWHDLALGSPSSAGSLDIDISSSSTCALLSLAVCFSNPTSVDNAVNINYANIGSSDTDLRFVGVGGGGVGDNPVFTEVGLTLHVSEFENIICLDSLSGVTSTTATIVINCNAVSVGSNTFAITWTGA